MIVVLGASGRLGGYLFKSFKNDFTEVLGTYCDNKKPGLSHFNLENMVLNDLNVSIFSSHLIIAAASNPRIDISKDINKLYKANVLRTKTLINDCFSRNITPVYISTDNVFDGEKGDYKETDKTNPINNYGKMKCEIEEQLITSDKPFVLLRMGKVFGIENDNTLILETFQSMQRDKKVLCATDQIFTPLYVKDLYNFVKQTIAKGYQGIFHLASTFPLTRYSVAEAIKSNFNLDAEIIPCKINEIGLLEKRPLKIDLNTEKYRALTGKYLRKIEDFFSLIDY